MPITTIMMRRNRRIQLNGTNDVPGPPNNSRVSNLGTQLDTINDQEPMQQNSRVEDHLALATSSATSQAGSSTQVRGTARRGARIGGGSRTKWTRTMNMEVMKAFYRINQCEDIPRLGYRHLLYEEYKRIRPDIQISEQNIVDRYMVIKRKKYLTEIELQQLKREVGNELYQNENYEETSNQDEVGQNTNVVFQTTSLMTAPETREETIENLENNDNIKDTFLSYLEYFRGIQANMRPSIPILKSIWKAKEIIKHVDTILGQYLNQLYTLDFEEVHLSIYCAAATVLEFNNQKIITIPQQNERGRGPPRHPAWKARLEKSIDEFRAKADIISEYLNGTRSRNIKRKIKEICKKFKIDILDPNCHEKLLDLKDVFRQKAKLKGARLSRYNELAKRKEQNKQFSLSRKKFFRNLEAENKPRNEATEAEYDQFKTYWSSIWSINARYNDEADWLIGIENEMEHIPEMSISEFTSNNIADALKKTQNWKSPGPDKLQNFWLKSFISTHAALARLFTMALEHPEIIPHFLTEGNTYLLYKEKGDTSKPENYRPITCLSVVYKVFTSLLNNKIYAHCETNNIFSEEQKGCIRKALGCKQQLTIDAVVMKQAQVKKRNLHMCYIDYKKAFDSTPHNWLLKVLNMYKISPSIINVLNHMMSSWRVNLHADGKNLGNIHIRRGIFQGDSFSPVWFCLAINPLSTLLNSTKFGYKINVNDQRKLSHLLFMDDLKVYAESKSKLHSLISIVKQFSNDICMSFGLDKCASVDIRKGQVSEQPNEPFEGISELEPDAVYQYLGIPRNSSIDHSDLKKEFIGKYRKRVTKLLNTKLSAHNLVTAINSWAIPILTYSFGILKWSDTDLNDLDRWTRSVLSKFRCLHPNSSSTRLYIPRKEGGRGLVNISNLCKSQQKSIKDKLLNSNDDLTKRMRTADNNYTPLNLSAREESFILKTASQRLEEWKSKVLHGKFPNMISSISTIDKYSSFQWLKDGNLYPETEGFVLAIQDRVICTKNYEKHILKLNVEDRCRKCNKPGESIEHIMAGCSMLADNAYLGRHNQLAKIIHQQLGLKHGLLSRSTPPYYKYSPAPVLENHSHLLYWDRPVLTDTSVPYNRPDIILIDKVKGEGCIIDIAIPLTHNIMSTEGEKIRKYEDLAIQLKQIWKLKSVYIYPIVMSVEGVVSKNFKNNIQKLMLNNKIFTTCQRAILLQTCHITRKFLNSDRTG
jgi:hypothetical protein